jgi:hypothetical protein
MGRGKEGKIYPIKRNMSSESDVISGEIKTSIALMVGRIS